MRCDQEVNFSSHPCAWVTFPRCLPELFEHCKRWVVSRKEEEGIKSDRWDDDKRAKNRNVEALKNPPIRIPSASPEPQ